MTTLGDLELKEEDFYRADLQRAFGDNAEYFYKRLAEIANHALRERLEKAPGMLREKAAEDQWIELSHDAFDMKEPLEPGDIRGRLVCVERGPTVENRD